MPHNTPEKRRAYINARAAKLRAEDPERVERDRLKKQANEAKRYVANKAEIDAKHKQWYDEKGGKESSSIRKKTVRGHSWEEYVEEQTTQRKQHSEYMKVWNQTEKGQRARTKRSVYNRCGLEIEEYDAQYDRQEGKCTICGHKSPRYGEGRLVVDHCHETGNFRSLLCGKCNSAIGFLREDEEIMKNAVEYVKTQC